MGCDVVSPYFAIKSKYTPNLHKYSKEGPHAHSYWQIATVSYGCGFVMLDDESYSVSEGDVIIISPETTHMLYVEDLTMTTYEFKFDTKDSFLLHQLQNLPQIIKGIGNDAIELSRKAVHEAQDAKLHSEQLVAYIIAEIVLILSRFSSDNTEKESNGSYADMLVEYENDPCAAKVRKIIEDSYSTPISTSTIAKSLFLSTSYICRKFFNSYHTTPLKYLSLLRLEKARQLLESSELSITEIALMVGFTDIHYFSRSFKSHTGLSPSEYRDRAKSGYAVAFNETL